MTDLRHLARPVLDEPPIPPTPVEELRERNRRRRARHLLAGVASVVVVIAIVAGLTVPRRGEDSRDVHRSSPAPGRTPAVSTLEVGGATDVALGAGSVWVPGFDVVRRIDPARNAVVATIPVAGTSDYRSVTVAFGSVWVSDTGTGQVTRIDPSTDRVVATIPVTGSPTTMAGGGGLLWVSVPNPTDPGGLLVPIDPATNTSGDPVAIRSSRAAPFASLIAVDDVLFATWDDQLARIDPRTRAVTYVPGFGTGDAPVSVAEGTHEVFVLRRSGRIMVLSPDGTKTRGSTTRIASAQEIATSGKDLWVITQPSSRRPSELLRLDATTLRTVGRRIEVGPQAIGIAAGSGTTWVANYTDSTLTRIDLAPDDARPELCPGHEPFDRIGSDGLPKASEVVTDRARAERALRDQGAAIRAEYPDSTAVTVGRGFGRAWTRGRGRCRVGGRRRRRSPRRALPPWCVSVDRFAPAAARR